MVNQNAGPKLIQLFIHRKPDVILKYKHDVHTDDHVYITIFGIFKLFLVELDYKYSQ